MAKKKKKFYVVWKGKRPGIYETWADCKAMTHGYEGARYKSFFDFETAKKAFNRPYAAYAGKKRTPSLSDEQKVLFGEVNFNSIAVDAACSGNPGRMEYRGVDTRTKKVLFKQGPFELGTNNVGEFLAIVHGLAFLHNHQSDRIIYSDSKIAINWVRQKTCRTKLKRSPKNEKLFQLVDRALDWLKRHDHSTPIVKWETTAWGEIPADFGRK